MKRRILIGLALMVAVGILAWLGSSLIVQARSNQFNENINYLFGALQEYKEHVGSFPVGSNRAIAEALKGKNSKNVIIVVGRNIEMNEKGEFVDPWGTALHIYFSDIGVLVRSAGPNKQFDDSKAEECDDFFCSN